MKITLETMSLNDGKSIIDIFNYYIENSFSAYPEKPLPYEFFSNFLNMCQGYPAVTARNEKDEIIGFGMLRPYNPISSFSKTAEITYFIKPDFTGHGAGKVMLDYLIEEGKKKGLTSILASISSLNEGSLRFHLKNGFVECGRLKSIGIKKSCTFDVVYCQKMI